MLELVDPDMKEYPEKEVTRYMKVALFCTQSAASRRPLMTQVVDMLSKEIQLNEKELTAPGFFMDAVQSSQKKSYPDSSISQIRDGHVSITMVNPR